MSDQDSLFDFKFSNSSVSNIGKKNIKDILKFTFFINSFIYIYLTF